MWYKTGRVFYERRWKCCVRIIEVAYDVPPILDGPYTMIRYIEEKRMARLI